MHLAIISPYPPNISGISLYGYHVSQALAQSGLFEQITVLTSKPTQTGRIDVSAPIEIKHIWEADQLNAASRIVDCLQKIKPDVVWFNLGASIFGRLPLANLSGFLAPFWARKLGFPTVVTLHELVEMSNLRALNAPGGPLARYGARLLTYAALQGDVICLTMQRYTQWLSTHRPGLRYAHIPMGAYYKPEILSEGKPGSLLFFSTLAPFKGLEILLNAFENLQADYPDLSLTIAGAQHMRFPAYTQQMRKTAEKMRGVRWLGEIPDENIRTLFQESQLVILPYLASTGSSNVLCQAATWGRAVIASDLPELIAAANESDLAINYFRSGDVANLQAQIRAQLAAPAQGREQVAHNFAAIQRNRSANMCHAYLHAFNTALEIRNSQKRINVSGLEKI